MFDRVIVVDWSASSRPTSGRDSIWIAVSTVGRITTTNPRTRASAVAEIEQAILDESSASTLLGVDFSLGYPAGTADMLGLDGRPWSAMWRELTDRVVDADTNANNRFAVAADLNRAMTGEAAPFWGCPPAARRRTLHPTKPGCRFGLDEWRAVEARLRDDGRRPFSGWQLFGAGAVGGQSLVGIPRIAELVERLGDRAEVWPFTTGLQVPMTVPGTVVVAEVWPSMFAGAPPAALVRDEHQVIATVAALVDADRDGTLSGWFRPEVNDDERARAESEEGWVLGA